MPVNSANAFPFRKLDSNISRSNYNFQSMLNGLIEWNNSKNDYVTIRLTKDTDPWFEDYTFATKNNGLQNITNYIYDDINVNCFNVSKKLEYTASSGLPIYNTVSLIATQGNPDISFDGTLYNDDNIRIINDQNGLLYTVLNINITNNTCNLMIGGEILSTFDGTYIAQIIPSILTYDNSDYKDHITARITVNNDGNTLWQLYQSVIIYPYNTSTVYATGNVVKYWNEDESHGDLYIVSENTVSGEIPNVGKHPFKKLVVDWYNGISVSTNDYVNDGSNIYIVNNDITSVVKPSADASNFEKVASVWSSTSEYSSGEYVYRNGLFYVNAYNGSGVSSDPSIYSDIYANGTWTSTTHDTIDWIECFYTNINDNTYGKSTIERFDSLYDIDGFILKNVGTSISDSNSSIGLFISTRVKQADSIYDRTVGIYKTCNYVEWPYTMSSKWNLDSTYGPTDTTIGINNRQVYSSIMILDHSRSDLVKTVNFINYDGPDLDQGLCVYLPVESNINDNGIVYPEDAFTFEFMFRIWPNSALNGKITNDNIINKAQIYVYSALNRESIENDNCNYPIAKFSMARLTNFYVFAENIAIPNRPVCYKAKFIYSKKTNSWKTLDYYQLPDHMFVGPIGFIDPNNASNSETVDGDEAGSQYTGLETAGFPLYQDPFSNFDLTPYKFSDSDSYNNFHNRII